jgi:hypothetical protein
VTFAPVRAEGVGSLLRPRRLRDAREAHAARVLLQRDGAVASTRDVRNAIHMCRGNRDGHSMASGGDEAISNEVFVRATGFETFLLEYDDERSGGFEPPIGDCPLDEEQQERELRLVADVAERAWAA